MSIAASVYSHGHLVYNELSRDMKAIQVVAPALLQLKKKMRFTKHVVCNHQTA